jgi:superfamily II DNA or RNA helicase
MKLIKKGVENNSMLNNLDLNREYIPFSNANPENFFRTAIKGSIFYRRSAGYFSSSILELFKLEYLDFALRGGKIELICSNQLTREDFEILQLNEDGGDIDQNIVRQLNRLTNTEETKEPLSFFATLVSMGLITVKIARYKKGGIFHDKTGLFEDTNGHTVTFRGSANETFMGWSKEGNFETLETFRSWDEHDVARIENHRHYLKRLWENKQAGLTVKRPSEITLSEITKLAREEIDDFRPILEKINLNAGSERQQKPIHKKRTLLPFQEETLQNWEDRKHQGIIKHATGTGKTVTAIEAIRRHTCQGKAALVLVPSVLLLHQWRSEIKKDLPESVVFLCGDGNGHWKKASRLANLLRPNDRGDGAIIIAILDTASSQEFLSKLSNFRDLLLVVDEVHNIGVGKKRDITNFDFQKRLGLSATPERYRDPDGTDVIFNFFGDVLSPVITIKEAIEMKRLVEYLYFPVSSFLDSVEMEAYKALTQKIIRSRSSFESPEGSSNTELTKKLLIQRSRIVKKAAIKVPLALSIIIENYIPGEYWLIYCEDTEQLDALNDRLRENGISPHIYTTRMNGSKEAELSDYTKRGGVMLSIGCLDEGVDIPKISHAVILASSQNPRQFIQRRGRVLRQDGVKIKATIYDLFAFPPKDIQYLPETMMKAELKRALEFATTSLNKMTAMDQIKGNFLEWGVRLEDYVDDGSSDGEFFGE